MRGHPNYWNVRPGMILEAPPDLQKHDSKSPAWGRFSRTFRQECSQRKFIAPVNYPLTKTGKFQNIQKICVYTLDVKAPFFYRLVYEPSFYDKGLSWSTRKYILNWYQMVPTSTCVGPKIAKKLRTRVVFATGVVKEPRKFSVFCIARTYMRCLGTHVGCYATALFHATQLRNWSHLKRSVPKSLCSRSKSDRRFNPRMEQYVYSYMCRFNNETGGSSSESCPSSNEKRKQRPQKKFFFLWVVVPNVKLQKLSSATNFGGVFTHL